MLIWYATQVERTAIPATGAAVLSTMYANFAREIFCLSKVSQIHFTAQFLLYWTFFDEDKVKYWTKSSHRKDFFVGFLYQFFSFFGE